MSEDDLKVQSNVARQIGDLDIDELTLTDLVAYTCLRIQREHPDADGMNFAMHGLHDGQGSEARNWEASFCVVDDVPIQTNEGGTA